MKNAQMIKHGIKSLPKKAEKLCDKVGDAAENICDSIKDSDPLMVHKKVTFEDVYYKKSAPGKPLARVTADFDVNWYVALMVLGGAVMLICCARRRRRKQKMMKKAEKSARKAVSCREKKKSE